MNLKELKALREDADMNQVLDACETASPAEVAAFFKDEYWINWLVQNDVPMWLLEKMESHGDTVQYKVESKLRGVGRFFRNLVRKVKAIPRKFRQWKKDRQRIASMKKDLKGINGVMNSPKWDELDAQTQAIMKELKKAFEKELGYETETA